MDHLKLFLEVTFFICAFLFFNGDLYADPINCDLQDYQEQPGLRATVKGEVLTINWEGDRGREVRASFTIIDGNPIIHELAIRASRGEWKVISKDVAPEYRIVSGIRRVTQQQTEPLIDLGIPLTSEKLDEIKWEAFWDAPLYIDDKPPLSHESSIPAEEPFANHPGMPRKPDEVSRVTASYDAKGCKVRTRGSRLEVVFDGVEAGIFSGYLQFDVFKGSNLIRQVLVAKTEMPSAAFKYDAGLKGLDLGPESQLIWRDLVNHLQNYRLGGPVQKQQVIVKSSNRVMAAEFEGGSLAVFPPPHSFYWARESEQNLGYSWYQKDGSDEFSFGIRQAELEEDPEFYHNFALYNARPGLWQQMPMFIYVDTESGMKAINGALAFTRSDQFKALPGHKVMGHHYHVGMVKRLNQLGNFDQRLNDIGTMKGIGVDIFSVIDGARGPGRHDKDELYLKDLADYYDAARRQSDVDFLVMPSDENSTGGRKPLLGGHYDILPSKPLFWRPERLSGQPLVEDHPVYGKVYNLGTPEDFMKMAEQEDVLVSMPHPRAKRSTGYPDAILNEPHFQHPNYFGLGYRWGMGIDASETRLGEYRFQSLWDETNNLMAEGGHSLKFALAISEARSDIGDRGKPPYDDAYGMSPVNYLKIDEIPSFDDMSPIIEALKQGEYFVTSGEVLIPSFSVKRSGMEMVVTAEVEWTFPLDFVEVVWGDGKKVGREIISAKDLQPFGSNKFEISIDVNGKKWLRFAAWDVATNGAMTQPIKIE